METLTSSFYRPSSGEAKAFGKTELLFGDDIVLDANGVSGYTQDITHDISEVYLNGVKLSSGAGNDYVVSGNTITFSSEWTFFNDDKLLITT